MHFQAIEMAHVAQRASLPGLRWGSIFAGTCVGIAVYVLMMLLGICVGMAKAGAVAGDVSVAALGWNLTSAFAASVLVTFIAARSADLRRSADGAMHGLVVWSCATLLVVLATLCLVRDVTGNMALLMSQNGERETSLAQNERQRSWNTLRQTGAVTFRDDRPRSALFVVGEEERAPAAPVRRAMPIDIPAYAALMICAALAISLFGGIAGGLLGTRSPRRPDPLDQADWE